eukprot:SAG31_NODE_3453_length_4253_cov_2.708233_3_plen_119_part_00
MRRTSKAAPDRASLQKEMAHDKDWAQLIRKAPAGSGGGYLCDDPNYAVELTHTFALMLDMMNATDVPKSAVAAVHRRARVAEKSWCATAAESAALNSRKIHSETLLTFAVRQIQSIRQ